MAPARHAEDGLSALCLVSAAAVVRITAAAFTLAWTHSVERTAIEEDWRIEDGRLVAVEARVKGSGAGITVPDGAVLEGGFWRYRPALAPLLELSLARSDAVADWRLCVEGTCRPLGELVGAPVGTVRLRAC